MLTTWFLSVLLLLPLHSPKSSAASVSLGANVGGVGIWINAGGNPPQTPPSDSAPDSADLARAYTALQAWKSSITDDPFGVLTSWVGSDVCSYKGVFCSNPPEDVSSSSSGLVIATIDLNRASLRGSLVKELSLLTHLSILHLNTNRFTGTVPETFKDLQFLSELDLSNNVLSGPFPKPTLSIQNLIYLDLRFNNFSGEVPEELFEMDLDAIFLNNNRFDGQIPASLWSSPASVITLANNGFTGTIPASFGYTGSGIKEILFFNNRLTGCIPEGVGFLPDIEVLDMSFNSLTGQVPSTLSCLSEIEILNIAHNHLTGTLPELVCSLRSLLNLTISYNFFSGFSQECTKLIFRNAGFNFSGNCIPGRGMQRPQPECTGFPGGGLSCLRIPSTRPMACSTPMGQRATASGPRPGFQYSLPTLPSRP